MTAGFYRAEVAEGLSGSLGHASAQVWLGVWLLGGLGGDQCLALPETTVAALAEGLLNESSDRKNAARDDCARKAFENLVAIAELVAVVFAQMKQGEASQVGDTCVNGPRASRVEFGYRHTPPVRTVARGEIRTRGRSNGGAHKPQFSENFFVHEIRIRLA